MEKFTLAELSRLGAVAPDVANFAKRLIVKTYDEFIDILYDDLDRIVSLIEENPELHKKDSEDRITIEITRSLRHQGYQASHETKHGGHCDVLVSRGNFCWIGEAKKHNGYDYLMEGFLQLTTRYSTGDDYQQAGGMLIYHFEKNTHKVMTEWANRLTEVGLPDFTICPCCKRKLPFYSSHTHEKSGLPFKVRHIPVMFHFDPKDKSGRTRRG